jgi:hypothetical protein
VALIRRRGYRPGHSWCNWPFGQVGCSAGDIRVKLCLVKQIHRLIIVFLAWLGSVSTGLATPPASHAAGTTRLTASLLCRDAIQKAEIRYGLPRGLLLAIGRVETGRPDPLSGQMEPWPWSVQAEGRGYLFDSKLEAIRWVTDAMSKGIRSIDTGCLQVNLLFHPDAFSSLDQAFDPRMNVDYAARFLSQLHASTGEWERATGFYNSQEPVRSATYQARVRRFYAFSGGSTGNSKLSMLRTAWAATFPHEGDSSKRQSNDEFPIILPLSRQAGRNATTMLAWSRRTLQ